MGKCRMALTAKQQAFVTAYLDNGMSNASAAYRAAYPGCAKWDSQTIANAAYKLLQHGEVSAIMTIAREKAAELASQAPDRYAVTKDRISQELARMAFVDPRGLYEWTTEGVKLKASADLTDDQAGAVQAVSHTVTKDGGTIRVELADRRRALMDLAKLHGHIVEKRDVRLIRSVADLSEAELEALAGTKTVKERQDDTRH